MVLITSVPNLALLYFSKLRCIDARCSFEFAKAIESSLSSDSAGLAVEFVSLRAPWFSGQYPSRNHAIAETVLGLVFHLAYRHPERITKVTKYRQCFTWLNFEGSRRLTWKTVTRKSPVPRRQQALATRLVKFQSSEFWGRFAPTRP